MILTTLIANRVWPHNISLVEGSTYIVYKLAFQKKIEIPSKS